LPSATRGGNAPDGRKVKATMHWVSATESLTAEVREYVTLFLAENPDKAPEGQDWRVNINPESLNVINDAKIEPSVADAEPGTHYQFERLGYFCIDSDSTRDKLVFNRTVTLRDAWANIQKRGVNQ
jgi:glutaminyl-tRNA synthetase